LKNKQAYFLLIVCLTINFSVLGGGFHLKYYKPENSKHQKLYKTLKNNNKRFFGDAIKFLNALYKIPNSVQIVVADCGFRNSRYHLGKMTIYICYETLQYKIEDYRSQPVDNDEYSNRVFKNSVFTFWHEIGHAMIHQLGLPTSMGSLNEEDLADEFAVLSMIWREDSKWTNTIVTSSLHYKNKVFRDKKEGKIEAIHEYHSPNIERYYNMTCLLYGAKPVTFERLKEKLNTEPKGASHCKSYYNQRDDYWSKTLKPYTKYGYF